MHKNNRLGFFSGLISSLRWAHISFFFVVALGVSGCGKGLESLLGAPTNVSATGGDFEVTVTWAAVSGASSYNVYYGPNPGVTKNASAKVIGARSGDVISGLLLSTTYYVAVTAVSGNEESLLSTETLATTNAAKPGNPVNVSVRGGALEAYISWPNVVGADSYNVYYGNAPGLTTSTGIKVTGVFSEHVITGLNSGESYYFLVTAENVIGESIASAEVSVTLDVSRFLYAFSQTDKAISIYTVTGGNSLLRHNGNFTVDPASSVMAVDPLGRFLYVAQTNTITSYAINQVNGQLSLVEVTGDVNQPGAMSIDPSGRYVYVANNGDDTLTGYRIEQSSGKLTPVSLGLSTGLTSTAVSIDAAGKFMYVANSGSADVSVFAIDSESGILTATGTVSLPALAVPGAFSIGVGGRFAYVSNTATNQILSYDVDPLTGLLSNQNAHATGLQPGALTLDPTGRFAYVGNVGANTISQFSINSATGSLSPITADITTGDEPSSLVFDHSGQHIYVANRLSNELMGYAVDPLTGGLTFSQKIISQTGPVSISTSGGAVQAHYQSPFVYVVNSGLNVGDTGTVSAFSVNSNSGELTSIDSNGVAVSAGVNPASITIGPLQEYAYVLNAPGAVVADVVSVFRINSVSGALEAVGGLLRTIERSEAVSMVVAPSGDYAYVGFSQAGSANQVLASYSIDRATGLLTYMNVDAFGGQYPKALAMNPTGNRLYVLSTTGGLLRTYNVSLVDGSIVSTLPDPTDNSLKSMVQSPSGFFLYSVMPTVAVPNARYYNVSSVDGALTKVGPHFGGQIPNSLSSDPLGRFIYAADSVAGTLSSFIVDQTTGALTRVTDVVSAGAKDVLAESAGRFVYLVDSVNNAVVAYEVDASVGTLTELPVNSTVATGINPVAIVATTVLQ